MKEHLIQIFKETKLREQKKLSLMKNPERKLGQILSFKGINEIYFLEKAFIQNDVMASKEFLYKMAIVNSYYSEIGKHDIFEVLNTFTFPVLSDCRPLIERYLAYEPIVYHDSFSSYFSQSIQTIIEGNDILLEKNISGLERHSKSGWEKNFVGLVLSLKGFLAKDKNIIEEGIDELLSKHDKQNHLPITKEYINYEATTLVKLAYRIGIQLNTKSPLIPEGLIPIQELSHYPGYDFFDELPPFDA